MKLYSRLLCFNLITIDLTIYIYKETNLGVDTCPRQIGFKPHDILIPQFVTGKQNNNKKIPTPIAYINFHYANPLYI